MPELDNRMTINGGSNGPDWNAREMPQWECSCGEDYTQQVAREGYPKWRQGGRKFVEECSAYEESCGCEKHVCHACAATCRVCGRHYCPEHQAGFHQDLRMCEECGSGYEFAPDQASVDRMAGIEREILLARARLGHEHLTQADMDWLIGALKEAWEEAGTLRRRAV